MTLPLCQAPVEKVSVDPPSTLWNEEMCRLTTLPRVSRVSKRMICILARYRDAWSWVWFENDAYVGNKARNPFNFQLFNLIWLKLLVNEEYPTPGIELEDNGHYNGYNSLFLGSGTMHQGQGLQVERREWSDGYFLFTWDLTPDGSGTRAGPDKRSV